MEDFIPYTESAHDPEKDVYVILRDKRKELDMSLAKVSELSGLAASTIHRFENGGVKNPTMHGVLALCRAYHMSLDALFGLAAEKQTADERVEILEREIRLLRHILIAGGVIIGALLAWLIIDALHGGFGFIRYVS